MMLQAAVCVVFVTIVITIITVASLLQSSTCFIFHRRLANMTGLGVTATPGSGEGTDLGFVLLLGGEIQLVSRTVPSATTLPVAM